MTPSWIVWSGFALYFLAFELTAVVWKNCPWHTLSTTATDLIGRTNGWAAVAYVAGLSVLIVHLIAPGVFDPSKRKQKD